MTLPEVDNNRIEKVYRMLEETMSKAMEEGITYYEINVALAMIDASIKAQNVSSYIQEEVNKLDRELNNRINQTNNLIKREDIK